MSPHKLGQHREAKALTSSLGCELHQVAVQGRSRDQERTRCLLTLQELQPLPDSVNAYKGLGRACVSTLASTAKSAVRILAVSQQLYFFSQFHPRSEAGDCAAAH